MAAQESGDQPKRLAAAILAFAQNADKLDALKPAIERIAARHVATHIKPEHYPAVADALLPAIKDVLGDAVDDTVLNAWGEAYRSEEHTSELQSLMRISYAVFCLKKKKKTKTKTVVTCNK